MANIGEQLLQPENGWKRIDDTDTHIIYNGDKWTKNSTLHYIPQGTSTDVIAESSINIYMKTNKIRIIAEKYYQHSKDVKVLINNVEIGHYSSYSNVSTALNSILLFEYELPSSKVINLTIKSGDGIRFTFDAVDISEDGYLLTEEEYIKIISTRYLIKDNSNSKVYNYDEENNKLVEVTDISILKENVLINTCIYDLNKVLPLLSNLSDDLTLLSNKDATVLVNGIKSTKELIVGKNSFSTRIASNIDWFKLDDDAAAKVVFSIDNGITWKTYNTSNSAFEDLSVSIPNNKDYKDFTDEEKIAWNEAKEIFYNQGIDSSILNTIDFNSFDIEDIRFGYVLTAIDSNTIDKMKNLIWQFDSKGTMDLVDTSQVKQQLYYAGTKLISNINADMLKVNITYEGINNNN